MKLEIKELEEKIIALQKSRSTFSEFLEAKMDEFDYSNTTLAKKVFHQIEDKETREVCFVPVTRQAIASWLRGTMPGSREIYVSLGMAFQMSLREINKELLEVYMGTGLYCKNIDDAIWIAVIHQLFPLEEMEKVRLEIEKMVYEESDVLEEAGRSILTTDLWQDLEAASTKEEFYRVIRENKEEFRDGARKFGVCLDEVILEEYGSYEKNTEFLADIGCLHCEAQFSKIRAGKAIVTREWLLRFLLSMQPSYESIEKLLKKAQMEPLGITPVELVIEFVARKRSSTLANSQEIWSAIEGLSMELSEAGIAMDDELSRKYDGIYAFPWKQKVFFAALIGKKLMENRSRKDYGFLGDEYVRHQCVDQLLFEEMNRFKKNTSLKNFANHLEKKEKKDIEKVMTQAVMDVLLVKKKDDYHGDCFMEYCYQISADKKSKSYYVNDLYFYSALLYSIFTGKCYTKDFDERKEQEVKKAVEREDAAMLLVKILRQNLSEEMDPEEMMSIKEIILSLLSIV